MPLISVAVRRVHDVGLTGWLILVPGVNLILWCMPSKNNNNYFDDNNVFEPSRIIALSLIWAGFIASTFLLDEKLVLAGSTVEQIQESPAENDIQAEEKTEDIFTGTAEDSNNIQEIEEPEQMDDQTSSTEYDGEIIQTDQLDDGTIITLRRHTQTLTVRLIQDTNIYDSIKNKVTVGSISIPQEIKNTGIATPRALVPFIENHQNADGTVNIPEKLQPYMGGKKIIGKNC